MSNIIFCKTRYQDTVVHIDPDGKEHKGYGSYVDLWNMVKWAGYETIYVDELDPQSDNTYIVTPLNIEWQQGWKNPKAQIIHLEMEWRTDERANWKEPEGVARVWHIDKWFADKFGFEYVPIGGDERLNELGTQYPTDKIYDVAIMSYQTPRRQTITAQLENMGMRLSPISNLWGNKRSDVLLKSYCMTHVHQNDGIHGIACLRWALAAAHSLPMITETVNDRGIFGYSCMVQSDYEYLAAFTASMLRDKHKLADYGAALHDLLCRDYTFQKAIESHV